MFLAALLAAGAAVATPSPASAATTNDVTPTEVFKALNHLHGEPVVSADGSTVVFPCRPPGGSDSNNDSDICVGSPTSAAATRHSVPAVPDGTEVFAVYNRVQGVSEDGSSVLITQVIDHGSGDYSLTLGIWDRGTDSFTTILTFGTTNYSTPIGNAVFSNDGETVVFSTNHQVIAEDTDDLVDVYAYDVATDTYRLLADTPGFNSSVTGATRSLSRVSIFQMASGCCEYQSLVVDVATGATVDLECESGTLNGVSDGDDVLCIGTRTEGPTTVLWIAIGASGGALTEIDAAPYSCHGDGCSGGVQAVAFADDASWVTYLKGSEIIRYDVSSKTKTSWTRLGLVRGLPSGDGTTWLEQGPEVIIGDGSGSGNHSLIVRTAGSDTGPSFSDVPGNHPFAADIAWLANSGITGGYDDGTFRPTVPVARQAMAAFLYRYAGEPVYSPPGVSPFTDVPTNHIFYKEIAWLADAGVSSGYDDGSFRPTVPVARQAMAAFLWRFAGEPTTGGTPPTFTDVPGNHPFGTPIGHLAAAGITGGYDDGTFRPTAPVARQAMAAFLNRANQQLWHWTP